MPRIALCRKMMRIRSRFDLWHQSRAFERMNAFFNKHEIHPVIDKVYSFEQAREAYEHLGRGAFGKVVIRVTA